MEALTGPARVPLAHMTKVHGQPAVQCGLWVSSYTCNRLSRCACLQGFHQDTRPLHCAGAVAGRTQDICCTERRCAVADAHRSMPSAFLIALQQLMTSRSRKQA